MINIDPDELLNRIRLLCSTIEYQELEHTSVDELVTDFQSLDAWLTRGGFLPKDWQNATPNV